MDDQDLRFQIVDDGDGDDGEGAGVGEPAPVKRADVLPPNADDAAAVDAFLSGYGRGFQVSIVRTAPVWCAGYLTTLPLDHGITLNEIRESYGGRRFQLRILTDQGRYVAMRTVLIADVPRDDGKPLVSLDRGEAPKSNPAPASGFGDLAGVFRDLLSSQQAAADRQAALLEQLIMRPAAEVQTALAAAPSSPLRQIQELGEVIAAVRELAPAVSGEGGGGGGDLGDGGIMLKLVEKLVSKWGDKPGAAQVPPGAPGAPGAPGRAPGAPGARRPPIIIQGPRPAGIPARPATSAAPPAPAPAPSAPSAPSATTIAAMQDARAGIVEPVPNPAALLEQLDEGATLDNDGESEIDDQDYTAEDVRDLLAGMPVIDAAEVIRDVFAGLNDADKQTAIAILVGEAPAELNGTPPDGVNDPSK
jgi:hypothetical protein